MAITDTTGQRGLTARLTLRTRAIRWPASAAPARVADGVWLLRDGSARTSDCSYVIDPQSGRPRSPHVPHRAFDQDTEQARASLRRLAELPPRPVWPGHGGPLTGDVRRALTAAEAP